MPRPQFPNALKSPGSQPTPSGGFGDSWLGSVPASPPLKQQAGQFGDAAANHRRKPVALLPDWFDQAAEARIYDSTFVPTLAAVNFQSGASWNKKLKKTWQNILEGDYDGAAREAEDSLWNQQSPKRVKQFADALRSLGTR